MSKPRLETVDGPDRRSGRAHAVAVIFTAAMCQGFVLVTLPSVSERLGREFGVSPSLYGALYLPMVGVAALTALTATPHRLGARLEHILAAGLVADAIGLAFLTLSGIVPGVGPTGLLVAAVIGFGVAFGCMGIGLNASIMTIFGPESSRALGWTHGILGVGAALGPLWFSTWDGAGLWRVAPGGLAVVAATLALLGSRIRLESAPQARRPSVPKGTWRLAGHATVAALYGALEATFASWAVLFLTTSKGLSSARAAGALSLFWLAITGGRLLGASFLGRGAAQVWIGVLTMGCAAGFLCLPLVGSPAGATWTYLGCGLACSVLFPLSLGLASRDFPEHVAVVASRVSAALMVGLGLGAFWVGPVSERWGFDLAFRVAVVLPAALAGLSFALQRRRYRSVSTSAASS